MKLRLRVKEVMEAKGITRTRLSRLADVNYKTIDGMVRDPYREVEFHTVYKIAKALGVGLDELVEELPDDSPS